MFCAVFETREGGEDVRFVRYFDSNGNPDDLIRAVIQPKAPSDDDKKSASDDGTKSASGDDGESDPTKKSFSKTFLWEICFVDELMARRSSFGGRPDDFDFLTWSTAVIRQFSDAGVVLRISLDLRPKDTEAVTVDTAKIFSELGRIRNLSREVLPEDTENLRNLQRQFPPLTFGERSRVHSVSQLRESKITFTEKTINGLSFRGGAEETERVRTLTPQTRFFVSNY